MLVPEIPQQVTLEDRNIERSSRKFCPFDDVTMIPQVCLEAWYIFIGHQEF